MIKLIKENINYDNKNKSLASRLQKYFYDYIKSKKYDEVKGVRIGMYEESLESFIDVEGLEYIGLSNYISKEFLNKLDSGQILPYFCVLRIESPYDDTNFEKTFKEDFSYFLLLPESENHIASIIWSEFSHGEEKGKIFTFWQAATEGRKWIDKWVKVYSEFNKTIKRG